MNVEWLRQICLSFPHATEQVQWCNDLVFKVAGKMFAVTSLEPSRVWLSFKASPDGFAELTERPNIIPAPYLSRAQWVALETNDALRLDELSLFLRESYNLVLAKLPKRTRDALSKPKNTNHNPRAKISMKKKRARSR